MNWLRRLRQWVCIHGPIEEVFPLCSYNPGDMYGWSYCKRCGKTVNKWVVG